MTRSSAFGLSFVLVAASLIATPFALPVFAADTGLKIWKDPAFQKQFLGTYGVRTDIEPNVTGAEREAMEKVLEYMGEPGGMGKARDYLKTTVEPAHSAVFDFTLANIYFQQDELDRAVEWYLSAIEKFPAYQRAFKNLGLAHVRQGACDKAPGPLTRAVELGATDGLTFGLLGYAYLMNEQYLSAENAYRQAVMLQPDTLDWKTGLARCFFRQGKFADAASLCDELIKDDPASSGFWLMQANAYLGLEQPMKAAANYEYLDTRGESTLQSLNTLGDIYVNAGTLDLAADAYLRALARDDAGNTDRFIRNGEALAARGAYDEAERVIVAAKKKFQAELEEPDRKRLLKLETRIAASRDAAGEEQARLLQEIVDLDPLDGEALILLARLHDRAGEPERARFLFERAAGLEAFEGEARLRHGQSLVRQGRYREALPLLRRALEIRPRDSLAEYIEQVERAAGTRS